MKNKEQQKQVKGQQAVENQSLIKNMDTSKNLFSQFSAQYLKQKDDLNDREDVQQFIQKQDLKFQEFFHSFDQNTQRILHGLNKKNETTKLKALNELKDLLNDAPSEFFDQFTPTYINIYIQYVSSEHEKKILEEANNILLIIGQKGKKSIQGKFKTLFPHWFILINDSNQDVSTSALNAFSIFFPKEKWGSAVILCQNQYFNNLKFYLKFTPKSLQQENMNISEAQAEYIYERLQISAIRTITTATKWIQSLKQQEIESFISELMKNKQLLIDLLDQNKKRPAIISSIIDAFNGLLNDENTRTQMMENIEVLAQKTLLKHMDDRERGIQQALWRGFVATIVRLLKPENMHKLDPQQLETKTLETLKKAAMGIGKSFYDQLIIYFAHLPSASIYDVEKEEIFKQRLAFIRKFLEMLLQGGTNHEESRFFCDHAINCYFEIVFFTIQKRMIPVLEKNIGEKNFCKKMAKDLIIQPVNAFLQRDSSQQNAYNYNPFKQTPFSFAQIFMISSQSPLMVEFLVDIINESSTKINYKDLNAYNNFLLIIEQIIAKTKENCVVYNELKSMIVGIANKLFLMENLDIKEPDQTIRNLDNALNLMNIFVSYKNEFMRDVYQSVIKIDYFQNVVLNCLENLFAQIQFTQNQQFIIRYSQQINMLQLKLDQLIQYYNPQEWNPTFNFLIKKLEEEKQTTISRDQQLIFKLKWVCFYQLAVQQITSIYYINFFSVKGESIQEWQLLESEVLRFQANIKPLEKDRVKFMDLLVRKTYNIQNMSLKIFLPAIYYSQRQQELFLQKIDQVSAILIELPIDSPKFKSWLGIYEELFYLGTQFSKQNESAFKIYDHFYDILWIIYRNQQSQKANKLLQIFNAANSNSSTKQDIPVQQLLKFLVKQFSDIKNIESLLSVLSTLLDSNLNFINQLLNLVFSMQFYTQALVKPYIWQIIKCIHNKQSSKVEEYLKMLYNNEENYQLFTTMLASVHSVAVLYNHRIKRFLQNLISNVIKTLIINDFEQNKEIKFLLFMAQQESQMVGVALKQLLKELLLEEQENYGDQQCSEQMKQVISQLICKPFANKLSENDIITLRSLFNELNLRNKEINSVVQESMNCEQLIERFRQTENLVYLDLVTMILRKSDDLGQLEKDDFLNEVIQQLISLLEKDCSNYKLIVFFDFINLIIERKTMVPFAEYVNQHTNLYISKIQSICSHFKQLFKLNQAQPCRFYSFAIIAGLQFLRKIISFIEAFPGEFVDFIIFSLTDSCLSFVQFCEEQSNIQIEEQNDQMFIEYAETMLRMLTVDQLFLLDEHFYYELLKAPFISVQKAAFLTLKQFQLKKKAQLDQQNETILQLLQSVDIGKEEKDMIARHQMRLKQLILEGEEEEKDDIDIEEIITFPLSPSKLAYLLTWLIVKNPPKEEFSTYLNNLLYIYSFLEENGVQSLFTAKEIYECSVDLASIQDDQSELLKLIVVSFYQFIANQQAYFKKWLNEECNKDQRRQLEYLVVEHVSKTIFLREVEIIETSQFEWQTEEFQIYVARNIGEISAVYQKEQQKIEIVITVPNEYPLKQLRIEAKKGVKLGEDKLKRWALMIRMILQNNNDTILSAILLWKSNIDKQFEGLEECAICYYVIHQTGEIPKMSCKTCKHKFHSSCIQKWFQTSNKSECPLCKSQFL